ncbi:hypothetical protein [Rugamonas sp.]|uniref:hypothetical protein n=1 Tax=Rugamonas sp. TaxID=1926287 RepID=UPI0025E465BE|nr:hypothetical protein [Rugamonas sp.]
MTFTASKAARRSTRRKKQNETRVCRSRGHATKTFDSGKETLDHIAVAIVMAVELTLELPGCFRRDHRLGWFVGDAGQSGIGMVGLVCQQRRRRHHFKQCQARHSLTGAEIKKPAMAGFSKYWRKG